jgi:lysophospholipase L1-like esterase
MIKTIKHTCILAAGICLLSFAFAPPKRIKVFLAGDSTMSVKETKYYPETGWGMPFALFFDSSVTVINKAKNGRSSRTFIEEGLWKSITDQLSEGDYVLIQFGHNDEVPTKKSATIPSEFKNNLVRYVEGTRTRKATPILLTPMARRSFDSAGQVQGTHDQYAAITREVAKENNVLMIDMDEKSQQLLQSMGRENSKLLFNHLMPGEHPNYPEGKEDNTHFNELGARKMAQLVLRELRKLDTNLSKRIYPGSK